MTLVPVRPPGADDELVHAIAQFTRGAGLSPDELKRILEALRDPQERGLLEAAMEFWLSRQGGGQAPLAIEAFLEPEAVAPSARADPELVVAYDAFDAHSEHVRALRTELLMRQSSERCNAIAVLSPGRGEGRSRLAAELAIVCAQLGEWTLLVDADLRSPRQHRLFQVDNAEGLAQAVNDDVAPPLRGVHGFPRLHLVTSGPPPGHPLELLSGARFGDLLAGWRRRYRHIIIDTPPVGGISDGLAVAMHCQGVLVVSRAGHTPLAEVREMLRRLGTTPVRVLGSVVGHF